MLLRAFRTCLLAALIVGTTTALATSVEASPAAVGVAATASPDDAPPVTANPFLPEERGLGECISAIPKPGCGSEERGGWRQQLILLALLAGLSIIGWRIVHGIRATHRPAIEANAEPQDPLDQLARPGPPPPTTIDDGSRP